MVLLEQLAQLLHLCVIEYDGGPIVRVMIVLNDPEHRLIVAVESDFKDVAVRVLELVNNHGYSENWGLPSDASSASSMAAAI